MPTSLRTQRLMQARRESVRRMYGATLKSGSTSAMAVDTLSRLHNVSKATIYKDLQATEKEAGR